MSREDITILLIFLSIIFLTALAGYREKKSGERKLRKKIKKDFGKKCPAKISRDRMEYLSVQAGKRELTDCSYIDDISFNDLDLDKIFLRLDHAYTAAGEEALYNAFRHPLYDDAKIRELKKEADYYAESDRYGRLSFVLASDPCRNNILSFSKLEIPSGLKLHFIAPILLLLSVFIIFLDVRAGVLILLASMIINIAWYFFSKPAILPFMELLGSVSGAVLSAKRLSSMEKELFKDAPESILARSVEMTELSRSLEPFKKAAVFISSGASKNSGFFSVFSDYINMLTHLDMIIFSLHADELYRKSDECLRLREIIGRMELPAILASFIKSLDGNICEPVFSDKEEASDIYHPLLNDPVANSYAFDKPLLLTGSNASGKSTFLKTCAVNMIFARTFGFACAKSFKTGMKRLYSSMSLRDDITAGQSYFYTEISAMKRILDAAAADKEHHLVCMVDEILRGTNTVERIAASSKILEYMAANGTGCFAATHDIELTQLLGESFEQYHFEEEIDGMDVRFNYLIKEGPAKSRNAILLLEGMGYDKDLVNAAGKRAEHFLKEGIWE